MQDIKPIETVYNGYRFRSRLEARFAVFLDSLHVEYEYEPEGYELGNGKYYLPDFKVKCCGTRGQNCFDYHPGQLRTAPFDLFIEVKGNMSETDAEKIYLFSQHYPVLIVGHIPNQVYGVDSNTYFSYREMNGIEIYEFNYYTIDGDYFAAYPAADKDGNFYLFGDDSSYINSCDVERVNNAWDMARQARFEYGENPF